MNDKIVAAELVLLLAAAGQVCAAEPNAPFADFDAYANAALADWQTPGLAVAIIKDGKVPFTRGYGVLRAGEDNPVNEKTIFPIASITKVFTTICLAQLVDEAALKWNDPVVKHLPEFELYDPFLTKDVRVNDLLSHRVGVETADMVAFRGDYERTEIIRRARFMQPVAPFRSTYRYKNNMVIAAAQVLERVSGQTWEDFVRTRLLKPLAMNKTFTDYQELEGRTNVAMPHLLVDGKLIADPAWKRGEGQEGFRRMHRAVAPAGAIQSNVLDMAKFLQMYLNEGTADGQRLLKVDTVRTIFAPLSTSPIKATPQAAFAYPRFVCGCGLGWCLRDYRGRKIVFHGGASGAVAAMMPEENIAVVVLANRGCGIVYMLMHDIFDRLLGIPRTWTNRTWLVEAEETPAKDSAARNEHLEAERKKDTQASLPLSGYTGVYDCDLYGELEIVERDGSLRVQFGPNISGALRHWEKDAFRGKPSFPPNEEWIVHFEVSGNSARRLKIERLSWPEPMPEFMRSQ
jgi:CubicO group peptidase (beta-lactamase class C family)